MAKFEPTPGMLDMFEAVKDGNMRLSVHGLDADTAEKAVWEVGKPLLDSLGLAVVYYNQYRWFVRELAGVVRTMRGKYLVFSLQTLFARWHELSLDSKVMEMLLAKCLDELPAGEVEVKVQLAEVKLQTGPEPVAANSTFDIRHSELCAPEAQHA